MAPQRRYEGAAREPAYARHIERAVGCTLGRAIGRAFGRSFGRTSGLNRAPHTEQLPMSPPRLTHAALAAGAFAFAAAVWAQPDDTLGSPACRKAMAAVQLQEDQVLAARFVDPAAERRAESRVRPLAPAALIEARRMAARICLRDRADPALATPLQPRLAQPPLELAPGRVAPAPSKPAARAATGMPRAPAPVGANGRAGLPAVPRPAAAPPVIVGCDAYGCNLSDGTRANRSGPNLIGPRGLCVQQGVQLICP